MRELNNTEIAVLSSSMLLVFGIGLWHNRDRKRDKKASQLFNALERILDGEKGQLQWETAFDIHYIKKLKIDRSKTLLVLQHEVALKYAKQIYEAWKIWYKGGDDEAKVFGVFRELADKVQISQVAKAYQDSYNSNLIDVIKDRLSENEIKTLLEIIKKKPNSSYA